MGTGGYFALPLSQYGSELGIVCCDSHTYHAVCVVVWGFEAERCGRTSAVDHRAVDPGAVGLGWVHLEVLAEVASEDCTASDVAA